MLPPARWSAPVWGLSRPQADSNFTLSNTVVPGNRAFAG